MKLLTHNILMCNRKGCTKNNFPLKLVAQKIEDISQEPNADGEIALEYSKNLMQRLTDKIEWNALRETLLTLGWIKEFPSQIDSHLLENEDFLKELHFYLIRRQILEGQMVCNNCERIYEIKNGIPNMLLNEDEV